MGLFRKNKSETIGRISKDNVRILKKMCEIANVNFYKVDFDSTEWANKYQWDSIQRSSFFVWLSDFYQRKNNHLSARQANDKAYTFIKAYGFKAKN